MTERRGHGAAFLAAVAVLVAGAALRVVSWRDLPPGPWIDEAYVLRAARLHAALDGRAGFGTVPLVPPEAGFVNFWVPTPYLSVVSAVDRLTGGGLAAIRAHSIGCSLLLLLFGALLLREATRPSDGAFLGGALLLSTSSWLLCTGRWGWHQVATAALLVAAAWTSLLAVRKGSWVWALTGGVLLGAAQYGYPAAWLLVPVPAVGLLLSLCRRHRRGSRLWAAALSGALLVEAPLALHLSRNPERLLARPGEISPVRPGAGPTLVALGANAVAYGRLFASGGDANERHGNPGRPVLPPVVLGLALLGAAAAVKRGEGVRLVSVAALVLVSAGLLAVEGTGANAFRIAPAAPFLLVLAGVGLETTLALLRRDPDARRRRIAGAAIGLALVGASVGEARAFLAWGGAPSLRGAFGGPERELADALDAGLRGGAAVEPLVDPRSAARNVFVVEALVGEGGARRRPSIGLAPLQAAGIGWRRVPDGDVLYAAGDSPELAAEAARLGAVRVATGRSLPGFGRWALLRIPAESARADSARSLSALPELPPSPGGGFGALEAGLHTFTARGPLRASLDGAPLFGLAERPAEGTAVARLAAGPHRLEVSPLAPGARLLVAEPHGFVTLALGAE